MRNNTQEMMRERQAYCSVNKGDKCLRWQIPSLSPCKSIENRCVN